MNNETLSQAKAQLESVCELVAALNVDYDRLDELEEARQRIEDDALSVEVRSSWVSVGSDFEPTEYRIVLCTGAPHVEIRGDLDRYNEPETAELYAGLWFEPAQPVPASDDERAALLEYAGLFYFGE